MTSERIRVTLNGLEMESRAATLADLIGEQGYQGQRIATALNGDFVPARLRAATPLASGDRIEVLTARQGG